MKTGNVYESVADMLRATLGDDFAKEFTEYEQERKHISAALVLRGVSGKSERDVALCIGRTEKFIDELESSKDADVSVADLAAYLSGFGYEIAFAKNA